MRDKHSILLKVGDKVVFRYYADDELRLGTIVSLGGDAGYEYADIQLESTTLIYSRYLRHVALKEACHEG